MVQLLVLTVLARLLSVGDFGIVTAALAVIGLSVNLSHLGIGPAIVQFPHLELKHVRTAFTASVVLGAAAAGVIWVVSPLLAGFFRMPTLTAVLRALSFVCLLQGTYIVAESLLQRKMRFRLLASLDATTYLIGYGGVGILLALQGFGVWAFVGAHLAQVVTRAALLLATQPHPVMPLLERRTLLDLLRFGGGLTIGKIGNYVAVEGDNVVVGRWLGAEALGLYGRAYQLMAMPAMFVGEVLDRVLFPSMARLQGQEERLALAYRRAVALTALLVLPVSSALFVLAPEIVKVLLGEKWAGVIVPLQIFAAGMLFRTGYKISDVTVRAKGAVYRRAWRQASYAAFVLGGAWFGQQWGLPGVASGVAVAIGLNFALMAHLTLDLTRVSWRSFGRAHQPGAVAALALGAELELVAAPLRGEGFSPMLVLVITSAVAVISIALALRYVPTRVLGPDGTWMLRTLGSWMPARVPGFGRFRPSAGAMDASPRTLIVEFIGLPGAGKSTVARRVAGLLRDLEIPVRETLREFADERRGVALARKLTVVSKGILSRPWFAYRSARAVGRTRQQSAKDALKVLHNWILIVSLIGARARSRGVHLFDQGIFQALWSIGYSAGDARFGDVWTNLRPMTPKPDLVVIVECDPPMIVKRRIATRSEGGGSRIEKLPPDHPVWFRAIELLREVKTAVAQLAAEDRRVKMVVVDNSREGHLETAAATLTSYIRVLHANRTPDAYPAQSKFAGVRV